MQGIALSILLKVAEYLITREIEKAKAKDKDKLTARIDKTKAKVESIYGMFDPQ